MSTTVTAEEKICLQIFISAVECGVVDFCICPGSRNFPFIKILKQQRNFSTYYFYDERSAGFFALGKSRSKSRPVAIITTSGTAIAHLLPSAMEAYYTGIPLLLITADRPRRYRGCNSPQACEQSGFYGLYTPFSLDLEEGEECDLSQWKLNSPAHINVCLEESNLAESSPPIPLQSRQNSTVHFNQNCDYSKALSAFLSKTKYPLVIVSTLKLEDQKPVLRFLKQLNAPVYLEATSGLREEFSLHELQISRSDNLIKNAYEAGYPIDGVLRIGGVPTLRFWRDLENKNGEIDVFSINDVPFSGLSWGTICCTSLKDFFECYIHSISYSQNQVVKWIEHDQAHQFKLMRLFEKEPLAEPSLIHELSKKISENSLIYLGNSLPIREWDLAATFCTKHSTIYANRGLNGIDGQTSTFLGLTQPDRHNWAILGDLTTLHDLSAPWIIPQLGGVSIQIIVINNGGGKIFANMYSDVEVQNNHCLEFQFFANLWKLKYEKWSSIPSTLLVDEPKIIELVPDNEASQRFWNKLKYL